MADLEETRPQTSDPADEAVEKDPPATDDAAASESQARQAEPEEKPFELVTEGMNWYVLRVASNKEMQVRDALERKIRIEGLEDFVNRIVVPTQKERRLRGGTARVYERKLYPGYVFVEMRTDEEGRIPEQVWFLIKETTGVGDFIGSGGKPTPMPLHEVEKMLAVALKSEETPELANLNFKKGDRVKVTEGAFENFEGVVDEINAQKGTVRVIATVFGRATPIEIEYWQLEKL